MKKNYWIFPLIVLVLLFIAPNFRWEYTATKTTETIIYKWKTDIWSGEKWLETYTNRVNNNSFKEERVSVAGAWTRAEDATKIWRSLIFVFILITIACWIIPLNKIKDKLKL